MIELFSNIKLLKQKIWHGTEKFKFNAAAKTLEIETLEKAYGLVFSESFKQFLEIADGGMITEFHWSHYVDMLEDEPDGPKWSSFNLFSLDELQDVYRDFRLDNWMMEKSFEGTHPLIPICRTPNQEFIFMVSVKGVSTESPVFIAINNSEIESCRQIAPDFNSFMGDYLKNNGFPKIDSSEGNLKLEDYLKQNKIIEIAEEDESYEQIVERMDALMVLFPNDGWNYCERGNAHVDNGQRKLALNDFNKAIELNNNEAFFYYCRGDLILNYGSARKALIDLDIAVKLEPNDKMYLSGRAKAFFKLKKYKKALVDCNLALNQDGVYELALMTRVDVYRELGENEKADTDSALLDDLLK